MSSSFNIALVVEGVTDAIVLSGALDAILSDRNYIAETLQPDRNDHRARARGEGWGGVYRWCRKHGAAPGLARNPSLKSKQLIIIQLDADVAEKNYADIGVLDPEVNDLPCAHPCPPAVDTVNALETVVRRWLQHDPGDRGVICIPSRAIDAWMVPVFFPGDTDKLSNLECSGSLGRWLSSKQAGSLMRQSGKKNPRNYRSQQAELTRAWPRVKESCATAAVFEARVLDALKNEDPIEPPGD
ncbi:MAG: hypothetical protein QNK37_31525 [Acidobacteriota bacterium]|nr:hypothetical protein [Acidobacteriota bacterium]